MRPLLELGREHPGVKALVEALREEAEFLSVAAVKNGLDANERAWCAGAACHAQDLKQEVEQELAELEKK